MTSSFELPLHTTLSLRDSCQQSHDILRKHLTFQELECHLASTVTDIDGVFVSLGADERVRSRMRVNLLLFIDEGTQPI